MVEDIQYIFILYIFIKGGYVLNGRNSRYALRVHSKDKNVDVEVNNKHKLNIAGITKKYIP